MTMEIKIGADPEVFLYDTKAKEYVSAAGFFPGTKKDPFKVDKGAIQVDGIALEFNIDPASSEDEFYSNIKTVHNTMESMVKDVNRNWEIRHEPYICISKKIWDTVPDYAKELGCDPDYDYNGNVKNNPSRIIESQASYEGAAAVRTGSGHVHIGWTEDEDTMSASHFEDCRACSQYFHSRQIFPNRYGTESTRVIFYGGQGAFRPKSYGVELRSPSNKWLHNEATIRNTYRQTYDTFQRFANGL